MIVSKFRINTNERRIGCSTKISLWFPNRIFDLELKPRDFTVYCCLLRHSDSKDGSCFPSRRVIAKECGMDRKTVDSAIENLSSLGLVKKIQRHREDGTRTSNLYYVASLLE